ncbi:MAG: hypothetical protein ROO76_13740 [Terriglobia bacterium]|jgi:hypothetical protein|nr:hypothetical protein [Terriglobia bacterium]
MANRYLFKALEFMQFLIFLMFFVSGMYLFAMSRSPRSADFGEASTVARHGTIAIAVSFFFLAPLIGVWRRERWGWWAGLVVNVLCLGISYWALVYKQTDVGWGSWVGPLLFFVTVLLHLLSRPESWKTIQQDDSVLFKKTV